MKISSKEGHGVYHEYIYSFPLAGFDTSESAKPLESLFGPLFDEYFNGENQVVSKSSAVTTADTSDKSQQQPDSTSSTSTLATTVTADGNFDLTFNVKLFELFELNELKAQSQEKDTVIKKLKERINALSGKTNEDKIKQELEEIETINIELDHRVTKLIAENEHLKQTYKQLYDSIKPARVKPSTSASGSQPSGNIKKDKIRQTPSSTQMNKVEAHPRKVKSSFKNKDCVVQPKGTAHVQHSKRNANSELKCNLNMLTKFKEKSLETNKKGVFKY
ncbi:hypothetical protein Tco_1429774 [Tanacetum coccineum]